jgi:hypothetical protein
MLLDSSYSAKFQAPRRADDLHNYLAVKLSARFERALRRERSTTRTGRP